MKKFLKEFKEFISKGNVLDLAVGVIIGGAFSAIVTSLTDNIINPLINCIGGAEIQGKIHLVGENYIDYGAFLSAVINFLIMALIIFCIVKTVNKAVELGKKLETPEEEKAPVTKICPYCKSEIPVDAVKCCHCTSDIPEEE
ncbi:MAG: large conductance mechanosensitive channel protein MscL [Acetobacter sp.]|nr:large conductance mechanosensitive channel protein MscL [Bacteroides sp.]MCM1341908.1 large conductance mechanosensitive channel protein MscL [Acetobacter sp.]MCM1434092.1 large conductance mechanosensitive channel protein MscL [Clostridiales bacterium]